VSWLPPALFQELTSEPSDHLDHIHGHGREEVLEVRPRQAEVATLAQIKAPDALGEAALDTRPERIFLFELGCLLALAGGLHRLMVGLGPHSELPRGVLRRRTHLTGWAGPTGGLVKADPKHGIAGDIVAWGPFDTRMPLGTVHPSQLKL
jgi:hypothetical protein